MFYSTRLFYKISPYGINTRFVYAFHGFTLNRIFVVSVCELKKCSTHGLDIACYCLMIAILIYFLHSEMTYIVSGGALNSTPSPLLYARIGLVKILTFVLIGYRQIGYLEL